MFFRQKIARMQCFDSPDYPATPKPWILTTHSACSGGASRDRTDDIQLAKLALSQLSYGPAFQLALLVVGLTRLELVTPRLSSVCSNQLSYRPASGQRRRLRDNLADFRLTDNLLWILADATYAFVKEVIQPQVPLRLPCYDFTPVIDHTVVTALPKVKLATSGAIDSHGVTGGVYKARERIHRGILIRDY